MDPVQIEYRIKLSEEKTETFLFKLDEDNFDLLSEEIAEPPSWTELSFNQCPHCPLDDKEHSHCPLALQLYNIVERFHETTSIDTVELEVITDDRTVTQTLSIQNALASMLGLIAPICGCPKTAYMKPMARFHLPLASEEETIFRVTGMYLLAQYFLSLKTGESNIQFDGLVKIYEDLHIVNKAIAGRLQTITRSDSLKNAITLVDMYSILIPILLEDQLAEMRGFFEAYIPAGDANVATTNHLEKAKAFILELAPQANTPGNSKRPEWLKEVARSEDPEPPEQEESAADRLLNNADITLELEPQSTSLEGTKAVFKLPDD